jgi:hypothetical protein
VNGIKSWYAPEDLKIGTRFRLEIDRSIRLHDKLLIVLSENSLRSEWVEAEVESAFEEEKRRKLVTVELQGNTTVLFPVRIDDAVMGAGDGWAASIRRTRHIGDFRLWRDTAHYGEGFSRLLRDLKASDELDKEALARRRKLESLRPW